MSTADLFSHVLDHQFTTLFSVGNLPVYLSQHLIMLTFASALIVLVVASAARARVAGSSKLAAAVEALIVTIRDEVVYPALGEKYGRKYLDFFLTIAVLILVSNLLGLIPAIHIGHFVIGGTATGNFWINLAFALMVYVYGVYCAAKEHGIGAYFGSFLPGGVPIFLAPLIWFIEFAGMILKHAVLAVRLTANMMAGHLVLFGILGLIVMIMQAGLPIPAQMLLSLAPLGMALAIYCLELLVAIIQAGIFVVLSAIFFGMAVNPHH